ncbi:MAG: molybdopterin cofactor-binding domain-containing protein [Pseudomonadota bacterium]
MDLSLTVNDQAIALSVDPVRRLSDVLRNELDLTATKVGCDAGDCGACTVLIDGKTACACLTPIAQLNGARIDTAEGFNGNGSDEPLTALQESFLAFGAAQCGICTPGMLMTAKALLEDNPTPRVEEVEDALGGVLCRCTGYSKIIDAVMNVAAPRDLPNHPAIGHNVGAAIRHLDGRGKVTGALQYGADQLPATGSEVEPLSARVIRSPYHHAQFTIGDTDDFIAAHPGIACILDASDIPGKNCFGVIPPFADQPVFAENETRFRGEAIAVVVGDDAAVRGFAEEAFPVTWTELPHALTPDEAQGDGAPRLFENRPDNILIKGRVERGDVAEALETAAHKVSVQTSTPFIEHAYIEPEAGYAEIRDGKVVVFGCTQAPHMDREELESILGLSDGEVRVMPSACGGAFGSKLDLSFQPYVALAAMKTKRAVRIVYSRIESMRSTTKRHPSDLDLTLGADAEGTITGFDFQGIFNTGAYASWGPTVANRVPVHASGPYFIPAYRAEALAIHTHTMPAGAFRGFGVPQAAIAQEAAFDEIADKVGIDRLAFRIKNALRNGQPTGTGQVFEKSVGIVECLEALKPAWDDALARANEHNRAANGSHFRKGVGIAACWYGCGNTSLPNPSTILIGIKRDGSIMLHQGATDIGQGSNTVIAQIAADALGVSVHNLTLVGPDTAVTPDCGKTSASRQTYVTGSAALKSGRALREKILRLANVGEAAALSTAPGTLILHDAGNEAAIDLTTLPEDERGYVLVAEETYDPPTKPLDENGQGIPYAVYGYGAQIVELTVDIGLGTIKVDHITSAHDVGRAINPLLIEGQIEGGVAQGIGLALMEDYVPGVSENLHDYLIPTIGDMPTFTHNIIEVTDEEGPYGAKGLGEHVLIPTAPAIVNAIRHATGAKVYDLPATPDKVLAALKKVDRNG